MTGPTNTILQVKDLSVGFETHQGPAHVLDRVSLAVQKGEILGLVGESGCGKSVLARSILRLIPSPPGVLLGGQILFGDQDLLKLSEKSMRALRGQQISMIFQEPMTSLNPVFTIGHQMREVVRTHKPMTKAQANAFCCSMLATVRLPDPDNVLQRYPHELSGGMLQRVMIALALACNPALLLADEPTTALDVTVQGQILAILAELATAQDLAVIFVTHDMGVVAQLCHRVAVMYAGQLVEEALVHDLFAQPAHPYTQGLIASIPGQTPGQLQTIPGSVPSALQPPSGCRFHPRCPKSTVHCTLHTPQLLTVADQHKVACHQAHNRASV